MEFKRIFRDKAELVVFSLKNKNRWCVAVFDKDKYWIKFPFDSEVEAVRWAEKYEYQSEETA